jgi:hypothetical protein
VRDPPTSTTLDVGEITTEKSGPRELEELALTIEAFQRLRVCGLELRRRLDCSGLGNVVAATFFRCRIRPAPALATPKIEPVVFLRRQREQRFLQRALHGAQHVARRALFFRALLVVDDRRKPRFEREQVVDETREVFVVDDAEPRAGREVQVRRIDQPLHVAARPWHARERLDLGEVAEDPRAGAIERNHVGCTVRIEVELGVDVRLGGQRARDLVYQASLELPRLDVEFGARRAVDDADRHTRATDAVAQFGREIPLDLLAAEILDAGQDAANENVGAGLGKERRPLGDPIARIALAQMHLIDAAVGAGGRQQQLLAERPEAQEADAEFALQATRALRLQRALDRIADMRRDVLEVGLALGIPAHAFAVVPHAQVMAALLLAARDDDRLRLRIDAVLDELRHRLQRIALRQRDDRDRVPVVADAKTTARDRFRRFRLGLARHRRLV